MLFLKRLADAVEREAEPLKTYTAPVVRGGVGRELDVPWTPRDDAMLLLGVYKHGYRAYEEVRPFACGHLTLRDTFAMDTTTLLPPLPPLATPSLPPCPQVRDDPELSFSCRVPGPALPPPLPQPAGGTWQPNGGGPSKFYKRDVLPVPPTNKPPPAAPSTAPPRAPCFLQARAHDGHVQAATRCSAGRAQIECSDVM